MPQTDTNPCVAGKQRQMLSCTLSACCEPEVSMHTLLSALSQDRSASALLADRCTHVSTAFVTIAEAFKYSPLIGTAQCEMHEFKINNVKILHA